MDPRSDYNGNLEHKVIAGPPNAAASTTPSPILDVDGLMAGLALARPVVHSEADFQHAFAWRIQELFPAASVRLEVRPAGMERRTYIDIWAVIEGRPLAIELDRWRLRHNLAMR